MKWKLGLSIGAIAVTALVFHAPRTHAEDPESEHSRIQQGYSLAPVPLQLAGKNRALVGLGSYIVNAQGGCNECHTNPPFAPNGNPYMGQPKVINVAGYLAGGVQFGPFTAPNITPDANGKPDGLSFEAFKQIMRTGIDPENKHPQFGPFLQVMPWPVYAGMTDRDLRAVYEYLSSIPHVDSPF